MNAECVHGVSSETDSVLKFSKVFPRGEIEYKGLGISCMTFFFSFSFLHMILVIPK